MAESGDDLGVLMDWGSLVDESGDLTFSTWISIFLSNN